MKQYTIELSDAQDKALAFVALDQKQWIENAVFERCRVAIDEIVAAEVERVTASGGEITGSKEDIVMAAVIETAAERDARFQADLLKSLEK